MIPSREEMIELLHEANPVDDSSLAPPSTERVADLVAAMAAADQEPVVRRRLRGRRQVCVVVVGVVAAAGTAVAVAAHFAGQHDTECASVEKVAARVSRIVTESGLTGWRVEIRPEARESECPKAAVDSGLHAIYINRFP